MVARNLLCLCLLLVLAACGGSAPDAPAVTSNAYLALKAGQEPVYRPFPTSLPDESALLARQISAVTSFDGVSRFMDSGVGVTPNTLNQQWLALDGTVATPASWAIWRFPECTDPPNGPFLDFQVFVKFASGQFFYVAYADYTANRWVFFDIVNNPDGLLTSFAFNPASLPNGEDSLHSPGGFAYLAILAVGTNVQVQHMDCTTPEPDPIPGTDSIPDQFEDNDTLATCYPLTPGMYHASIHQSNAEMADQNELRDPIDCYCVDVPAGKTLTATLRHEIWDHFGSGFENDADLLFYFPGASEVYNDFDEPLSSTGIFYDPFEQVLFTNSTGSDMMVSLAVVGEIGEPGVRTNCEYDLGIFISDVAFRVGGTFTQNNAELDKDVVAYLTGPGGVGGNFNINTPVPGSGQPGVFSIPGVPPGTYELHAHGSARFGPQGYVWPETLTGITVTVADVTGQELDLGPDP
jgi:hypothetical protein